MIKALYQYQRDRFPLKYLLFTSLSSVLASIAVCHSSIQIKNIFLLLIAVLFFMFHIRVMDDFRDKELDTINHPERKNPISLQNLLFIDGIGILFNVFLSIHYGKAAIFWMVIFYLFSILTRKNFFTSSFFEDKPLLYHIVNSPQILIIQLFIFASLTTSFALNKLMIGLIILIYFNVFILEIVRKQKAKEIINYSHLIISLILCVLSFITYCLVQVQITPNPMSYISISLLFILFFGIVIIQFIKKKSTSYEQLLQLSGFIIYVGFNSILYSSIL